MSSSTYNVIFNGITACCTMIGLYVLFQGYRKRKGQDKKGRILLNLIKKHCETYDDTRMGNLVLYENNIPNLKLTDLKAAQNRNWVYHEGDRMWTISDELYDLMGYERNGVNEWVLK